MFADLSDDQRYQALRSRDPRFDGVFIVGVRTTGIYCRPSCPTPIQPHRKNVDFYLTAAAAQRAGLRACKRCRPDASPDSPEWNRRDDLVGRAMRMIRAGHLDTGSVAEMASELGTTERSLRRTMTAALGAPPLAIARAQRAQTARTLIETTGLRFVDVAFAAGFTSLRQFNDTIREVFAATPTELRSKAGGRSGADATARSVGDRRGRTGLSLRLPFRAPFADRVLLDWFDHRTLDGIDRVERTDDGGPESLHTALRLTRGNGTATLRFADRWVQCRLELDDVADLGPAVSRCRTLLDLDADPVHVDLHLSELGPVRPMIETNPGLRCAGTVDGFATLMFTIAAQQRSVAAARTLTNRLVQRARADRLGDQAEARLESDHFLTPFPAAAEIAAMDLSGLGFTRRNVATIRETAVRFSDRERDLAPTADRDAISAELLGIGGIGPWTVRYLALRVLRDPDVYCAGDLVAERSASAVGLDGSLIEQARPWRSYLTHHLWATAAMTKGSPRC